MRDALLVHERRCAECRAPAARSASYCGSCGAPLHATALLVEPVDPVTPAGRFPAIGPSAEPTWWSRAAPAHEPSAHALRDERTVALGGRASDRSPRRGLAVTAVAVALIGIGVAVGAGGGSGEPADPGTSSPASAESAPSTAAASARTAAAANTAPADTTAASSAPSAATTGAAIPPPTSNAVAGSAPTAAPPNYTFVEPPDLGGSSLYLTTGTGDLITVAPDGSVTNVALDAGHGDRVILARAGGVVMTDGNGMNEYRPASGGSPVPLSRGAVHPGPAADEVWVQTVPDSMSSRSAAVRQRVTDGTVITSVPLPPQAWSTTEAPDGGLFVAVPSNGTYHIAAAGTAALAARGAVVDASTDGALVYECDDMMRCGYHLLDLTSGASRPVLAGRGDELARLDPLGGSIALLDWETSTLAVVDIASGSRVELGEIDGGASWGAVSPMTWSPNGDRLFWTHRGDLRVWTRGSTDSVTVRLVDGERDRHVTAIGVVG